MLPQQIQTADFLDILFTERNKMYGAYVLRRDYNKRLLFAIGTMLLCISLCILFYFRFNSVDNSIQRKIIQIDPDINISEVDLTPKKIKIPPPPSPLPPVEKVASVQFTTPPKIVRDEDVLPGEQPPSTDDLEKKRIGLITADGSNDLLIPPPAGRTNGVIELPEKKEEGEIVFIEVEIESAYPGGTNAWKRYLLKTLKYPKPAQQDLRQGQVMVQFIVDKEGFVSNVHALSGPEALKSEAVRVISKSGKWKPAIQNGWHVKSYKRQVIVLQLNEE